MRQHHSPPRRYVSSSFTRALDYSSHEEVVSRFASDEENVQQSDQEIVLVAPDSMADEKLIGSSCALCFRTASPVITNASLTC
jgi:hypothetical protein